MPPRSKRTDACRAVFHVDEPAKWPLALTNAQNLWETCRASGRDCHLEIIANGPAVQPLTADASLRDSLTALHAAGVAVTACANALAARHIPWGSLPEAVDVVPAGVVELIDKQQDGYAYIKP